MACEYLSVEVMERWIVSKWWEKLGKGKVALSEVCYLKASLWFLFTCSWVSSLSWVPQLQQPVPTAVEAVSAGLPVHHPHPGRCAASAQGH